MNKDKPSPPNKPSGQSLVEFAIVLPTLLLMILGTMDFARLFSTKIVLTNAAREGASYLSQNPSDFGNVLSVINAEAQNITMDDVNISCTPQDAAGCVSGGTVTVIVTKSVDLIFGGFLQSLGLASGPLELSSTVRMMVR